jgi:hypothetical protein
VPSKKLRWSVFASKQTAEVVAVPPWDVVMPVAFLQDMDKHLRRIMLLARLEATISAVSAPLATQTSPCPLDLLACSALVVTVVARTLALEATWFVVATTVQPAAGLGHPLPVRRKTRRLRPP